MKIDCNINAKEMVVWSGDLALNSDMEGRALIRPVDKKLYVSP